jgi:hypothetical protein
VQEHAGNGQPLLFAHRLLAAEDTGEASKDSL